MMRGKWLYCPLPGIVLVGFAVLVRARLGAAPEIDNAAVVRGIDRSAQDRDDNLLGYTVTEHYTVFRNGDEKHPAAEMSVQTTYTQNAGKSYKVLNQSGTELLRKEVLDRALENEKALNEPANRVHELITSANYTMVVDGQATVDGRACFLMAIAPRQSSPYLFKGRIWVDATDEAIVRLEGVATKSASLITGPAAVVRTYAQFGGFPMATHASATISSWLLGPTQVEIDYTGYEITRKQGTGSRE